MNTKERLVYQLQEKGVLRTPYIIEAFKDVDRCDFVSPGMEDQAYYNIPLPIGKGQTISQPLTVAFMLELLQPHFGDKVLDIGAGSGWKAALLAHIVSKRPPGVSKSFKPGKVISVEIIPQLCEFCLDNLSKYELVQNDMVNMYCTNAAEGFSDEAPFDRIVSGAAADDIPVEWKEQLNPGGCIVAPVGSSIRVLHQKDAGSWEQREYPGFAFVPLVDE